MRIAFLGGFAFSPKGTMRARAHPLAAELVRLGHEVTIFLPPYDSLDDCGREWESEGVCFRNVGAERDRNVRGRSRLPLYARMLAQLIREARGYGPDVIHVFKPKGFAGAAATYFLLRRTPVVVDCDDWEGWGGWNEIKNYPWLVKEFIDWQERWLIRRARAVTVASKTLEARTIELRRGRQASVFYIPNCGASNHGRELQEAARSLSPAQGRREFGFDDSPVVLYSGHYEDRDSVAFFCRAAAPVVAKHAAWVVFVGNDAPESTIRQHFSGFARARVLFFHQLPYQKFLRLVWASDVAAFPYPNDAVHRAKCSARITDYMAMGKAVLTSAVGQNMEYIVDGESGLLAAPDGEHDFAAKLDRLLSEPALRAVLGQNARDRLRRKFDWGGNALRQCLAAYDSALNPGKDAAAPALSSASAAQRDRPAA